jgi:tetratricopeptide (TPR) repeat protein
MQSAARAASWCLLTAVLAVGTAGDVRAQTGRVQGRVLDAETGQPIRSATIVAESTNAMPGQFTAISDDKGRFAMLGLRSGTWIIAARAQGYEPMGGSARIQSLGQNPPLEFRLRKMPEPVISPVARLDVKAFQEELRSAQAQLDASRADEAIATYERLLEQLPMLTSLHVQLARAHLLKRDIDAALAAYARIPDTDARYEQARTAMGLIELERGNAEAADRLLEPAASSPGAASETLAALGDVKRARQQPDAALTYYQKAAEGDPSWAGPYLKLAQMAIDRGDTASAVKYLERAVAIDSKSADGEKAQALLTTLSKKQP